MFFTISFTSFMVSCISLRILPRACSISWIISHTSSSPTESLTSSSVIRILTCHPVEQPPCVMVAGCWINVHVFTKAYRQCAKLQGIQENRHIDRIRKRESDHAACPAHLVPGKSVLRDDPEVPDILLFQFYHDPAGICHSHCILVMPVHTDGSVLFPGLWARTKRRNRTPMFLAVCLAVLI